MKIALLITGNEILSGKTQDINGVFLSRHLKKFGISLINTIICGDDEEELIRCLSFLSQNCDVILMTGGLGPTSDDLTAKIIGHFFKVPLEFNEQAWKDCLDTFKKLGRTNIPESNKKQAYLPKGCDLLPNKMGTAAGFSVSGIHENKQVTVYCMPGVPYEMHPMFLNYVLPCFLDKKQNPIFKVWQVFFMGESAMQSAIETAEKKLLSECPDAVVSYQAHSCYVTYSIRLSSYKNELDSFSKEVKSAFGNYIIYDQDKLVAEYIDEKLKDLKFTLSVKKILNCNADYVLKTISKNKHVKPDLDFDLTFGHLPENSGGLLILMIRKQALGEDLYSVEKRLSVFHWKLNFIEKDFIALSCQMKLNKNHSQQVQQDRMEMYGLCSLAAILN
jgi:nicotinamide-nucleotide amidase